MKANYTLKNSGERVAAIKIEFIVTKDVIVFVIAEQLQFEPNFKITKTWVESAIRNLYINDGANHWAYRKHDNDDPQLDMHATQIARRLYPDFF